MWDIVAFSLILAISVFAAFYIGFYFGFMKREGTPPESMPIVEDLKSIRRFKRKKQEDKEPTSFYD
jgi:hypothetical protein